MLDSNSEIYVTYTSSWCFWYCDRDGNLRRTHRCFWYHCSWKFTRNDDHRNIDFGIYGSTFMVEVDPSGMSSEIAVTGTGSTVASGVTLAIIADPGYYTIGQTYTIVSAPSGITVPSPVFTTVTQPPGFVFEVLSNPTSIMLLLQMAPTPPTPSSMLISTNGLVGNALATANYINSLSNNPAYTQLVTTLAELGFSDLVKSLGTISPSRESFTTFAAQNTMFLFSRLIKTRLSTQRLVHNVQKPENRSIAAYANKQLFNENELLVANEENLPAGSSRTMARGKDNFAVWVNGLGQFARQGAQDQNPSFHVNTAGALVGIDYFGFENGLIGGAFGFARSKVREESSAGDGSVTLYTASLFGTGYIGNGYIESSFWGTYDSL